MPSLTPRVRQYAMAAAVFGLSFMVTLVAWWYIGRMVQESRRQQFDAVCHNLEQTLHQQWERYLDVLLGVRGFWNASEQISREEWRAYIESIRLAENFPGIQGIGFAQRVRASELQAHERAVQQMGFPQYHVQPAGARDVYFPIRYLEPFDARNQRAFGYDMFSDPSRRAAMWQAGVTGQPVATGRVKLVQETEVDVQPGLLVYVPLYRHGAALDTAEQRWDALEGFVYSPYRARNLIRGIVAGRHDVSEVRIQIYDGAADDPQELLYDSDPGHAENSPLSEALSVPVAGRNWLVHLHALPKFASRHERQLPLLVLASGLAVSSLLATITWLQIHGRIASEEAAKALAESEARFRLKIEQSPLAIQIVDAGGRTSYVNPAWQTLWESTSADLREYNLLQDPQLLRVAGEEIRRAASGEGMVVGPFYYDPSISGHPGRARWVRLVMYATRDTSGQVREVVCMQEDFTERKRAEEELRQAKDSAVAANQAKDQFLALLSHELRNPLAPVLTMVDVLEDRSGLSWAEFTDALDVIRRNVMLEARLIDDLLDITRITRGKLLLDFETADAHTVLQHALEICESDIQRKRQRVELHLDAADHFLHADPARLQQVFWNLIKNAVKFTPDAGQLTIRTFNQARTPTGGHAGGAGHSLVIEVQDDGIGIAPDDMGRIFNAFDQGNPSVTKRFGGLGLGLAISRALVEAHGGIISARSDGKHRGSVFSVSLPVVAAPVTAAPAAPREPARAAASLRILLVEDLDDARRALQLILRRTGYQVSSAANVQETLDLADEQEFDVLLSDLGLPDGSGFDLPRRLKSRRPQMVAVAISGLGMEEDVQRARDAGFDYHLTKPVHFGRLQTLLLTIAGRLGERQ